MDIQPRHMSSMNPGRVETEPQSSSFGRVETEPQSTSFEISRDEVEVSI